MSYQFPTKIEREEIIEHYVTESRRPPGIIGSRIPPREILRETVERRYNEESPVHDFSSRATSSALHSEAERRFYATGERDYSRDASFMQTSGMSPTSDVGSTSIPVSYPKLSDDLDLRTADIHSYGYDVHEVHTSEGGARIVQTHGTGLIHSDRISMDQRERIVNEKRIHSDGSVEEQRIEERSEEKCSEISSTQKSARGFLDLARSTADEIGAAIDHHRKTVYTLPLSTVERRQAWQLPESKLSRKDSYKQMQMGQQDDSADIYAPRSDALLITGFTNSQLSGEMPTPWEQVTQFMRKIISRIRSTTWTPRLIFFLLLFLLLVILFFILLGIILKALFGSYSTRTVYLYPPTCEKCHDGMYEVMPSVLHINFYSSSQVHFELIGHLPLRSNSTSIIDFQTGYIAVADRALIDDFGKQLVCFLMPLDRSAIPSISTLRDALSSVTSEIHSEYGWQEYWQYQALEIDKKSAERQFTDKIDVCRGATWYLLKHTVYTKDSSCSNCYDFCLPNYAIQRLHKYADDMSIGIRRLDCFRLHVPHWERYQVTPDSQGGHWSYPKISSIARGLPGSLVD